MDPSLFLYVLTVAWTLTYGQRPSRNNTSLIAQCGGEITGDSGYIASPDFPSQYPPNKRCTWLITVPEGQVVMLSFQIFDIEMDTLCRYDYLDVYNGHSNRSQRLGRFCGTFRPGAILSTSNKMALEMVSDEGMAGKGFVALYNGGIPHVNDQQFCGGKMEKPQGSLKTPNWPEKNYPAGISCSWYIIAPANQVIELSFDKFDVESDNYCRYDYVAIFNGGETDDSKRLGKFCGDIPPEPIISNGSELLVQFVSDLSVTSDGFMAMYNTKPKSRTKLVAIPKKPSKPVKPTLRPKPIPTKKPAQAGNLKPGVKPGPKPKPGQASRLRQPIRTGPQGGRRLGNATIPMRRKVIAHTTNSTGGKVLA
uniref:Procollagen C-endopeptidase enhancer n=1 Tax=Latimeria chalumnae TaxID=7897 RepID=H2ZSE4_LATCH